jgi:hypothetical protein
LDEPHNRNILEETNTGLFESDYRAPGVPRQKDNQGPTKCLQLRPRQFALTWGKALFILQRAGIRVA